MRNRNRINYVLDGVQYVQCTTCMEVKSVDMFCKSKRGLFGKRERCKLCDKKYREDNREYIVKYLNKYYAENKESQRKKRAEYRDKNRDKIREWEKNYYHENAERERQKQKTLRENGRDNIRNRTKRLINKLGIRPTHCPICGDNKFRIEAHHPDYNKRHEIVFCCKSCHLLIHSGKVKCPQIIDLYTINKDV